MILDIEKIDNFLAAVNFFENVPEAKTYGPLQKDLFFTSLEVLIPGFRKGFKRPEELTVEITRSKALEAKEYLLEKRGQVATGQEIVIPEAYNPVLKAVGQNETYVQQENAGLNPPRPSPDVNQQIQNALAIPKAGAEIIAQKAVQKGLARYLLPIQKLLSQALTKVLGGISSIFAGPVGMILTQAVTYVVAKTASWLKRNSKKLAAVGLGGLLLGGLFGPGGLIAGIGGGILLFTGLAEAAVIVALPAIIGTIAGFAFLVPLIMFIINSGAYMVPPGENFFTGGGPGGAYPTCWPIDGTITQGPHGGRLGSGIDIGASNGTSVYATHNGTATAYPMNSPENIDSRYGNLVIIDSETEPQFSTFYAHLASFTFTGTREVKAGDLIGYSDDTGNSTGPHLHYEIRPAEIGINSVVPPYSVGDQTKGCFAKDSGGGETPGPRSTPIPTPRPPSGTPPPPPGGKPASCTASGGECQPQGPACVPMNLPAGASGWDCETNENCCLKGLPAG